MKKSILISAFALAATGAFAQDTLLWADFETDPSLYIQWALPPGQVNDTSWYNADFDGLPDGSGSGRPPEWYWTTPFANQDTIGNTGVLTSSSWTNSPQPIQNILITKAVYIGDNSAVLSWKSAPFQTPKYLDGYSVVISTTDNDPASFMDTIFTAAEYESEDNTSAPYDFSSYTFNPAPTSDPLDPFVHGMDWMYIEANYDSVTNTTDSARWVGVLRPFSISLASYSGQSIYVMFVHNTHDDNLLSIDNIMITGTDFTGIHTNSEGTTFSAFPNPATDVLNTRYTLTAASKVVVNVYDVAGKLVATENKGVQPAGEQSSSINVAGLPAGMYRVELVTDAGRSNNRVVVQ
jgi:hypothetical protein